MDKQLIVRELKNCTNGRPFISITEIAKSRGKGRSWARELVDGLDYFREGRSKEYAIREVAERMMERMVDGK